MSRSTSFRVAGWLFLGLLLAAALVGFVLHSRRAHAGCEPATLASLPQASAGSAKGDAYKLIVGPYEVAEVEELILRDAKRGKSLPVRILYPTGTGPFPVVIFSHGAGASKECCGDLTRHWAGYGYVVLQPTHADSVRLHHQQGGNTDLRGTIGGALRTPSAWANRARDISFLLDSLGELERRVPPLKGRMDTSRIGVGGHSLGAYTAQLIGGATVDMPDAPSASFADPRANAILVLSGQGHGQQGLTEHSWEKITRPTMTMTGSLDGGAGGQGPKWKKEPFDYSPPGDKYHIFIEGARHISFIGPFAGALASARVGSGADQEKIFSYVQIATTAFWDAYLKADAKAKAYLQSDALETYSRGAVKLYRK
jgi:predicted dienelactone hydrolase